jgi:hypothetical protein
VRVHAGSLTPTCGWSGALNPDDFETWKANQLSAYKAPEKDTLAATGEHVHRPVLTSGRRAEGRQGEPVIAKPENYVAEAAQLDPPDEPRHVRQQSFNRTRPADKCGGAPPRRSASCTWRE